MRHFLLCFLLIASGCQLLGPDTTSAPDDTLIVRYGTSFGECLGDRCWQELELTESQQTLTFRQYFAGPITATTTTEQNPDTWQTTLQYAASNPLLTMDDVYGCPDCADGGAEWVEIQQGDQVKKVTFEYQNAPDRIEAFVVFLRTLR